MRNREEVDCSCIRTFLNPEDHHFLRLRAPTQRAHQPPHNHSASLACTRTDKSTKKSLKKRTHSRNHHQPSDETLRTEGLKLQSRNVTPKMATAGNRISFGTAGWHSVTLNSNSIPVIPLNEFSLKDQLSPLKPPFRPTYQSARPQMGVLATDQTFTQPLSTHKSSQPAPIIQLQPPKESQLTRPTISQQTAVLEKFEGFQQRKQTQQGQKRRIEGKKGLRERQKHKVLEKAQMGRMVESDVDFSESDAPSQVIGRGFGSKQHLVPRLKPSIETAVSGSAQEDQNLLGWPTKGPRLKLSLSRECI